MKSFEDGGDVGFIANPSHSHKRPWKAKIMQCVSHAFNFKKFVRGDNEKFHQNQRAMQNQDNDDALIEVNVFNFKGNDFFIELLPKSNYANDIISRVICVCIYAGWILIASARGCFYDTKINLQLIKLIEIKPVESQISFKSQKSANFL